MSIREYETVAHMKAGAHKLIFRYASIAFRRERCGFISTLNVLSGFVGLRFRVTQRPACTLLDEYIRSGNQAYTAAIVRA